MPKKNKPGRPAQPLSQVIRVPVSKLRTVEQIVGRSLADNQEPSVMVRVPVAQVAKIRKAIK